MQAGALLPTRDDILPVDVGAGGYDIGARTNKALGRDALRARSTLPFSIAGTMGSAAAAGCLAGFTKPEEYRFLFSYAAQQASGAMQGMQIQRDQPVKIESDTLEVRDKQRQATFSGSVKLTRRGFICVIVTSPLPPSEERTRLPSVTRMAPSRPSIGARTMV